MIYAKNKKAFHDYEVLDDYEAGIVLNGDEVKSIKAHNVNLKGSFVEIKNEEAFMREAHVSHYRHSSNKNFDPTRTRKILLHKKEIKKIEEKLNTAGVTAIPLKLYSQKGLIKLQIGICRGKKLHDKRETLKRRAQDLAVKRQLKHY
jgi:SsrA-binding protein